MTKVIITTILFITWTWLGLPAAANAQAAKTPTVTKKRAPATAEQVLDRITDLAEVKQLAADVERLSKGQRHVSLLIDQKPTKTDPYYWVKVAEDNGMAFVTLQTFLVNSNTLAVKYYDVANDTTTTLDLSVCRRRNAAQKK